jgi:hemerythrin-like domain-containing protein
MKLQQSIPESLREAHKALKVDLEKLEKTARSSSQDGLARLRTCLVATRAHIVAHFRFEEENGYMDKVRKREPRLERAIQQLADEHQQLLQSLDAILAQANAAPAMPDALCDEIRAWVERIRNHETRENHLVQEAFDFDIGAEA